jgi:hypothetical protein
MPQIVLAELSGFARACAEISGKKLFALEAKPFAFFTPL